MFCQKPFSLSHLFKLFIYKFLTLRVRTHALLVKDNSASVRFFFPSSAFNSYLAAANTNVLNHKSSLFLPLFSWTARKISSWAAATCVSSVFLGSCLVNNNFSAIHFSVVQCLNSFLGFFFCRHFHKSKTFASA